jgi:hypothetical protein
MTTLFVVWLCMQVVDQQVRLFGLLVARVHQHGITKITTVKDMDQLQVVAVVLGILHNAH